VLPNASIRSERAVMPEPGRASVLASPDFIGFAEELGLARTLALPLGAFGNTP
jgi:hypothetical protein